MPRWRVRTRVEASVEYVVEADCVANVVEHWNNGGDEWAAILVGDLEPRELWIDDMGWDSLGSISASDVSPEPGDPSTWPAMLPL